MLYLGKAILEATMPTDSPLLLSDLCEDVILVICEQLEYIRSQQETPLKSLSLTNRRLRDIAVPCLFRTVHIIQPVSQLLPCALTSQHARSCKVDMFGSMWWWCSGSYVSSSDALDLFRCIRSLKNLKSLNISMMRRSVDMFTAAFVCDAKQANDVFLLTRIEHLVVTSSAAFMASHCPNLKSLVVKDGDDCVMETYTNLTSRLAPLHASFDTELRPSLQLTRFDAAATWSLDEITALVANFPNLQHLRMRSDSYCYRASTESIMEILAHLKDLRTLHLIKSGSLGMGYQSIWQRRIHTCSDAEYRRLLWLENERLRVHSENNAARCAFGRIASLKVCWVGDKRVARKLNTESNCLQWMWERRRDSVDDYAIGDTLARWRMEKDIAVVPTEIGM